MGYEGREVYPAAPLALVAAEVRYAYAPRLRQQDVLDKITISLEDDLPVVQRHQSITVTPGPAGPESQAETITTLTNLATTQSLTIQTRSLSLETTDYVEFGDFSTTLLRICQAVIDAGVRPIVERIGLRYIDEIRVPEPINGPLDWTTWVDKSLVDQISIGREYTAQRADGTVVYTLDGNKGLSFRYAALDGEPVVGGNLKRAHAPVAGPFFVLDIDVFATYADSPVELSPGDVVSTLEGLHDPAGTVFQRALTEKARLLFRGGEK